MTGTAKEPYQVKINTAHVSRCSCSCPHAAGRPRSVCKHMVVLYFAAFPDEVDSYLEDIEAAEQEEAENWERRLVSIRKYVMGLSKEELRETLLEALLELENGSDTIGSDPPFFPRRARRPLANPLKIQYNRDTLGARPVPGCLTV